MPAALLDPRTITDINPNSYRPRRLPSPMWIACHTSESRSRVRNLNGFCKNNGVSYNRLVDDTDILVAVEDANAPWAAMGANQYAYHICWTSSFASWSRGQWLDDNPSDGFNERNAMRLGAKQIAYWIQQSDIRDHRPIPAQWMGGGTVPPWGRNGICGHVDFGAWGGGHHDPGPNFPIDVLMSDIASFLHDLPPAPPIVLPPVVVPGTNPNKYADWLEYQGKPGADRDRVAAIQTAMNRPPTPFGLVVDGDFGPLTKQAVNGFQAHVGLTIDGIVGPATAAALKP
jgi:hypothetical protein